MGGAAGESAGPVARGITGGRAASRRPGPTLAGTRRRCGVGRHACQGPCGQQEDPRLCCLLARDGHPAAVCREPCRPAARAAVGSEFCHILHRPARGVLLQLAGRAGRLPRRPRGRQVPQRYGNRPDEALRPGAGERVHRRRQDRAGGRGRRGGACESAHCRAGGDRGPGRALQTCTDREALQAQGTARQGGRAGPGCAARPGPDENHRRRIADQQAPQGTCRLLCVSGRSSTDHERSDPLIPPEQALCDRRNREKRRFGSKHGKWRWFA